MKTIKIKYLLVTAILLLFFPGCSSIPKSGQDQKGILVVQLLERGTFEKEYLSLKISVIDTRSNKPVKSVVTPYRDRVFVFVLPEGEYYLLGEEIRNNQTAPEKISFYKQRVSAGFIHVYKNKYLVDIESKGTRAIVHNDGWAGMTELEESELKSILIGNENFQYWVWKGCDPD
ncbi:MAG: hypothetical protein JXR86_00370 [Spirochaetales bacterium]|nr:hypothetical protein [Spirochaetales bacterium]